MSRTLDGRMRIGRGTKFIEWPTLCLAAVIYGGWLGFTFFFNDLPLWFVVPVGAWLIAWHSSLQHEVIHDHPTPWQNVNHGLGRVPLSLWLPFEEYRVDHIAHHREDRLTDPLDDPESYYWTPEGWSRLHPVWKKLIRLNSTLFGRLLIGPGWLIGRFLWCQARAVRNGDRRRARIWARHAALCIPVVWWLTVVCDVNLWAYALLAVYPGTALALIRSFAEHRANNSAEQRTAIVENAPIFGLLFLYNNLHVAHHLKPALPWYQLPGWYRRHRGELIARNGGLVYDGYADIFRRFLLTPHDRSIHPNGRAPSALAELSMPQL